MVKTAVLRRQARYRGDAFVHERTQGEPIAFGGEGDDAIIEDMDRLMKLYIDVQQAGFDGTEHRPFAGDGAIFYHGGAGSEGRTLFQQIERNEQSDADAIGLNVSRTLRGIRQIYRFGHEGFLEPIFSKHKVSVAEVRSMADVRGDGAEYDKKRLKCRGAILKEFKQKPRERNADNLAQLVGSYRDHASSLALHRFTANGVRLDDHIRLHQLMMRVVGRLTDFTLMWERDRAYLFFGLVWRHTQTQGLGEPILRLRAPENKNKEFVLDLPPGFRRNGDAAALPLWRENWGMAGPNWSSNGRRRAIDYLSDMPEEHQSWMTRYFLDHARAHEMDVAHAAEMKRKREAGENMPKTASEPPRGNRNPRAQIRNDFAHQNVLAVGGNNAPVSFVKNERRSFTYLVNAVRSLFGYDRKMKNAVSQAVTELLEREGLLIEWTFERDRLKQARITPKVEVHLDMMRREDVDGAPFALPRTSARFTSMAQALFTSAKFGHGESNLVDGKRRGTGNFGYPVGWEEQVSPSLPTGFVARQAISHSESA